MSGRAGPIPLTISAVTTSSYPGGIAAATSFHTSPTSHCHRSGVESLTRLLPPMGAWLHGHHEERVAAESLIGFELKSALHAQRGLLTLNDEIVMRTCCAVR